ncbi:MAG TPA: hypothetical protein VH081_05500 [Solirubrobacteraceae bacterium]|jgi:hypothetical protein|nr:hypothetical protein [Solirubrobacteraceae bacterium]
MLALLLAVALIGLTVLSLLLAGVVVAVVTAIAVLNLSLVVLGLRAPGTRAKRADGERWRPTSFRRPPELPPEPPVEAVEVPHVTIHRG